MRAVKGETGLSVRYSNNTLIAPWVAKSVYIFIVNKMKLYVINRRKYIN